MDLAEWWRGRRWRALADLIDQLPAASRTQEAILNDPDFAEMIAQRERDEPAKKPWSPRVRDYDLHAQLLREIRETIVSVRQAVIQTTFDGDGKPLKAPRVPILPGPETEVDRMKERLSRRSTYEIIAAFAPHALTPEMRAQLWQS